MKQSTTQSDEIVSFIRKRDYRFVRELGQGACGKTVLLYDDELDEQFVCKKYSPYSESQREPLFSNFVREIKLLHQIHHRNVVRVFNYYLYPSQSAGYILMEFVNGPDIEEYIGKSPEQANELFLQAISGFAYLEKSGILHRDIRPNNLLVGADGTLKIIDLGFGKQVQSSQDYDKSITLNWGFPPPEEFAHGRYDFATEVYFLGKLFERIIQEKGISHFNYPDTLRRMCYSAPSLRFCSFFEIEKTIRNSQFFAIEFDETELQGYREFANAICRQIKRVEHGAKYATDIDRIRTQLNDVYRSFMLEEQVPEAALVLRCIITGAYYYQKAGLHTEVVRKFLRLLKASSEEKIRIMLANLHTKLDALPRYSKLEDDDVPF